MRCFTVLNTLRQQGLLSKVGLKASGFKVSQAWVANLSQSALTTQVVYQNEVFKKANKNIPTKLFTFRVVILVFFIFKLKHIVPCTLRKLSTSRSIAAEPEALLIRTSFKQLVG